MKGIFSLKLLAAVFLFYIVSVPGLLLAEDFCYGQHVAMPDGSIQNPCLQPKCYRRINGQGEVLKWVKNENQCRYQSVGQSWGYPGDYKNFFKEIWFR